MNGLHHENGTPARVDQTIVSSGAGFGNDPHRLQDAALLAAANAIIFTDRRGVILWANPAFTTLTGYALDEVVGANPRVLKSGKHDPGLYRDLWSTILSGRAWHGEITNRRKDGTLYVEEMTITPVRGDDGEIANFIAIKQDVTRRKEAEEASERANADLLDADRRKDEFLAMLSHELRTPLAAILSAAGLLQQRKVEPETHHTADVIARQAGHMARLLDDLLDVSRVTGGKVALRKPPAASSRRAGTPFPSPSRASHCGWMPIRTACSRSSPTC